MASKTLKLCLKRVSLLRTCIRLHPFLGASTNFGTCPSLSVRPFSASVPDSSAWSLVGRLWLSVPRLASTFVRHKTTHLADSKTSWNLGVLGIEGKEDFTPLDDTQLQQDVTHKINTSLELGSAGRLFAVVYIRGSQFKVTAGDTIVVKFAFPPNVGDRIRLEKVLAVGGKDFSLIGQPLLSRDLVRIDATVVEKTLSHNRVWFFYMKRKNYKRFHLFREPHNMLVINSIQLAKLSEVEQENSESPRLEELSQS